MESDEGIPQQARTIVVIPTIFSTIATVEELAERLEVHFLANQDENIYFALLGDFSDAPAATMPEDAATLDAAHVCIEELNRRYSRDTDTPRFHLFHRRRLWNEHEGRWMGWERKRGKLEEFNRLMRGARDTSFNVATAASEFLAGVRYVITLDSDTQLPRDVARKLVGIATHPLNRPHFDASLGRVTRGYGILQPRVSVTLPSSGRSRFARIFSGNTGIDPYTTAASDVYQDLFAEGSFTGKGLYHVDSFEAALASRVPENSVLSHDLFEGLYARCGLVTDSELLDDFPAHYDTYAKRSHRWVRGDWQIARWLFARVPDANSRRVRNTLPAISRWKILDNLRRSLVAPAMLAWLVAAWTVLPGSPRWWTLFVVVVIAFPIYAHVTTNLLTHPRGIPWSSHFWSVWGDARTNTAQSALAVIFLAYEAYLKCDAIARTFYRKLISRRRLLEWMTAAQAESGSKHDRASFVRLMWPASLIAVICFVLVALVRPGALFIAAPFIIAWFFSPLIAYWVSRPEASTGRAPLTLKAHREVRMIARRTWRFFETFVGTEDNWLPPDNFQEDPQSLVAHRTSPTNIGLLLLSTVAAHDFGYVGTLELVERLELTFGTLEKLPRFRGQFMNWYDTRTLETLSPPYISTVDSGNLAGNFLTLKQASIDVADRPLLDHRTRAGLDDTLQLMRHEVAQLGGIRRRTESVTVEQLRVEVETCATILTEAAGERPCEWAALLDSLARRVEVMIDSIAALSLEHGDAPFAQLRYWTNAFSQQVRALRRDLETLVPWCGSLVSHLAPIVEGCSPTAKQHWTEITDLFNRLPSLSQLPELCDTLLTRHAALVAEIEEPAQSAHRPVVERDAARRGIQMLTAAIEEAARAADKLLSRLSVIARSCERFVEEMDFTFLLDDERKVFSIGYQLTEGVADKSFYDLLASEARLGSFVAIAKGDAPQEHWFRMGRALTPVDSSRALISWTATMFEYLMPLLVMRDFEGTLLNQTYAAVVARQIEYGAERGVPWGISESAYNARDLHLNYQYAPFGVPGLGLKRGLSEDLVVAPYATALAALVAPEAALENIRHLVREGALGHYGFYESIDYTPERLPQNQTRAVIRAFMAHHQGMILVAFDNLLHDRVMQRRFHDEPLVQATELLLQERIPRGVAASHPRAEEVLTRSRRALIVGAHRA